MLYVQWCNLPMDTHTTVLGSVVAERGGVKQEKREQDWGCRGCAPGKRSHPLLTHL